MCFPLFSFPGPFSQCERSIIMVSLRSGSAVLRRSPSAKWTHRGERSAPLTKTDSLGVGISMACAFDPGISMEQAWAARSGGQGVHRGVAVTTTDMAMALERQTLLLGGIGTIGFASLRQSSSCCDWTIRSLVATRAPHRKRGSFCRLETLCDQGECRRSSAVEQLIRNQ